MVCSIFSKYAVRSLPSIIIAHGSYQFWALRSKDLDSIVKFYTAVTGMFLYYYCIKVWFGSCGIYYAVS